MAFGSPGEIEKVAAAGAQVLHTNVVWPYFPLRRDGLRVIVDLFNGVNTTAHHGHPAAEVPLREEVVPIHGIRVRFVREVPKRVHLEPGGRELPLRRDEEAWMVEVPALEIHAMVVGEY
jgi:hypothetical protein